MTTHKATGTQLFISADQLPKNPTREDFERLSWKEVGEILNPLEDFYLTGSGNLNPNGILLKKPRNTSTKAHGFKPPKPRKRWN